MYIDQIRLKSFRNYDQCSINLTNGINIFIGKNGQGKTNLLESLYYLSCTKSHRTNESMHLLKKGMPFFMLISQPQVPNCFANSLAEVKAVLMTPISLSQCTLTLLSGRGTIRISSNRLILWLTISN